MGILCGIEKARHSKAESDFFQLSHACFANCSMEAAGGSSKIFHSVGHTLATEFKAICELVPCDEVELLFSAKNSAGMQKWRQAKRFVKVPLFAVQSLLTTSYVSVE